MWRSIQLNIHWQLQLLPKIYFSWFIIEATSFIWYFSNSVFHIKFDWIIDYSNCKKSVIVIGFQYCCSIISTLVHWNLFAFRVFNLTSRHWLTITNWSKTKIQCESEHAFTKHCSYFIWIELDFFTFTFFNKWCNFWIDHFSYVFLLCCQSETHFNKNTLKFINFWYSL